MKVLISGAGVAGLTAAYWLQQFGVEPVIVERAPGRGSSLAILGAYVLAGELAAADGDIAGAFAEYDRVMRPYVEANQALGVRSAGFMTAEGDAPAELTGEMVESVIDATTALIAKAANAIELKDYCAANPT